MKYPKIELYRLSVGMTKRTFCNILGVSYATYKSWQIGKNAMSVDRLLSIAEMFGCTANDLIGNADGTTNED